ncbi:MAG: hypothetical protein IPK80_28405 [Nannocystis sp.]|nr:hypothetical protein [Nannocystis sp.]
MIKVAPGCPVGKVWRRRGKGSGTPWVLIVTVGGYVESVPWTIKGVDLHMGVRISFYQIYMREGVTVVSPWGNTFELFLDFGDPAEVRIKGEGVRSKHKQGDLVVTWEIIYPPRGSLELASLLRYLQGGRW